MTGQNDLDRALGSWFVAEAAPAAPPEPLARVLETTRTMRPRPAPIAWVGSRWVGAGPVYGRRGPLAGLRPAIVLALVALVAVALAGALLIGSRLVVPRTPPRTYLNELVSAPDLSMPMAHPALVPLLDGRVLVIGDDGNGADRGMKALVYDPATGLSEPTGPLLSSETIRVDAAVRLKDGRVLVFANTDDGNRTQLFDPSTKQFAPVGPMITPRFWAAVAVLPDGHVLVAGGNALGQDGATSSAELFDPETETFSATGSMTTSRAVASTAVLPDGRVFVAPGASNKTVEVYDPRVGTFSGAGMTSEYGFSDAIALPDGRVMVIGRRSLSQRGFEEVWDPSSLTFSPQWELHGPVNSATLLDDGRILMVGGDPSNWLGIFDLTTGKMTSTPRLTKAWHPKATRLADGRVLIAGGLLDDRHTRPDGDGSTAPGVTTVEVFQ